MKLEHRSRVRTCNRGPRRNTAAQTMNDELDGEEVILGFVSFCLAVWALGFWVSNLYLSWRLRVRHSIGGILLTGPPVCVAFIWFVLSRWADVRVREEDTDMALLVFLGMAWLAGASCCFAWMGVNIRDDGIERNNVAAAITWASAIIGTAFCYAGANIGSGPSLWNNVFSALLATSTLAGLWLALEVTCGISSSITLERDIASGVRSGGFLAASGLILGRAVAGDWHSTLGTISDFARDAWPVLFLALVAFLGERAFRPTAKRISAPVQTHGAVPAAAYILLALGWLAYLGAWEHHQ